MELPRLGFLLIKTMPTGFRQGDGPTAEQIGEGNSRGGFQISRAGFGVLNQSRKHFFPKLIDDPPEKQIRRARQPGSRHKPLRIIIADHQRRTVRGIQKLAHAVIEIRPTRR